MDVREQKALIATLFPIRANDLRRPNKSGTLQLLAPLGETARDKIALGLDLLTTDGSGGTYAIWKAGRASHPVVYIGSEGQFWVAAMDVQDFLQAIAVGGPQVNRCMKLCFNTLTNPEPTAADEALLAPIRAECEALEPQPDNVAALAKGGVSPVANVLARIESANRKALWPFLDFVDKATFGVPARHMWFDSRTGKAALRNYTATEHYEVGDAISHSKFGPGVVVHALQGRMTVTFGMVNRTLARSA